MADNTTQTIQASLPGAGQTRTYTLTADTSIQFDFDLSEAVFSGANGNLEISIENGGTVILENYQALAEQGTLPTFATMEGEQVAGDVYLFAFADAADTTDEPLETAADGAAGGSGSGAYNDDAGILFESLDALGGQDDAFDGPAPAAAEFVNGFTLDDESPFDTLEPPESEDFTVQATSGPTQISFAGLASDSPDTDHVWDDDDDLSDTDGRETDITITSLPESGTLFYNGVEVTESDLTELNPDGSVNSLGTLFENHDGFTYEANDGANSVELGARSAAEALDGRMGNWGDGDAYSRQVSLDGNGDGTDDITVTTSMRDANGNALRMRQYTDGDDGDHIGHGLGDRDHNGIDVGETLTIDFEGASVASAEIGFSGLGGYFDPGSRQEAFATWVAYEDGEAVAWGTVNNDYMGISLEPLPTDFDPLTHDWSQTTQISLVDDGVSGNRGDIYQTLELSSDLLGGATFDRLEFGTTETGPRDWNSNWELGHVFADFAQDDSFDYAPVDSHGLIGNESTVTIEAAPTALHDGDEVFVTNSDSETVSVLTDDYSRDDFEGAENSTLHLQSAGHTVTMQAFTGSLSDDANPWNDWNEASLGLEGRSDRNSGGPGRDFNAIGVHEGDNEIDGHVRGTDDVEILLVSLDGPARTASVTLEALFGNEGTGEGAYLNVYGEDGTLLETRHVEGGQFDGRNGALQVSFDADDYGQAISHIALYADEYHRSDFLIRGVDYQTMNTDFLEPVDGNLLDNDFHGLNGDLDVISLVGVAGEDNAQPTAELENGIFTIHGEHGTLTLDAETGEYSYTPDFDVADLDANVTETFTYTVEDPNGATDTASLEFHINVNALDVGEIIDGMEIDPNAGYTITSTSGSDDVFPAYENSTLLTGGGEDSIVIDPQYMVENGGSNTVNIMDFSDSDSLDLGNMVGASVEITSTGSDVSLVFTDIDGADDIVVNLMGVNPVNVGVDEVHDITTSADLNQVIQGIIDSGNDSIV